MDEIRQGADLEAVLETFWGKASEAQGRGNEEEARGWLEGIVELDHHDPDAWLALAKLVPDAQERMLCYSQVLQLSPGNVEAKDGLRQARREL
jgi:hypothetical protein